ncbi:MAG: hypothetical protein ACJAT2_003465 [Bacteriovoracaceae bacterium]|jgi:hypothetical protein
MKILFGLALALLSLTALSEELRIEHNYLIKAERYEQFRAILHKDDGSKVDVTSEAQFRSSTGRERQNGEFYFSLPPFGSQDRFSARIDVTYASDRGIQAAGKSIMIDASPDSIYLWGMSIARSGGFVSMRAEGLYNGRRVDLSQKGYWSALYGRVNSWGQYNAPYLRNQTSVYDSITFRFGLRSARHSILVRK